MGPQAGNAMQNPPLDGGVEHTGPAIRPAAIPSIEDNARRFDNLRALRDDRRLHADAVAQIRQVRHLPLFRWTGLAPVDYDCE